LGFPSGVYFATLYLSRREGNVFSLTEEQGEKLGKWAAEQHAKDRAAAEASGRLSVYGASGGAFTYSFTPTSLGMVVKVKNNLSGDELDLTEWDAW
jgi:hypothetical protein